MCCTDNRIKIAPNVPGPWALTRDVLPFFKLKFPWENLCLCLPYDEGIFCQIRASLRLLLFLSAFALCSLLIKTHLVFISYFVSVLLTKDSWGLGYKCWFVRLYLFLFAFLIICIETFRFPKLFLTTSSFSAFPKRSFGAFITATFSFL